MYLSDVRSFSGPREEPLAEAMDAGTSVAMSVRTRPNRASFPPLLRTLVWCNL